MRKNRVLSVLLAAAVMAGSGAAASVPVFAAENEAGTSQTAAEQTSTEGDTTDTTAAATDAAEDANTEDTDTIDAIDAAVLSTHPGDLVEYLGVDDTTIQQMFIIDHTNATANAGNQYFASEGIVFQTNEDSKVEFVNMYQASDFSIRGVKIGMDNPTVRAIFTQLGWTEKILTTSIGDLWTFISPDGNESATVITDADGIVLCVAVTALQNTAQ